MLQFLLQHNLLPYVAIVVLSGMVYWQMGKIAEQDLAIKEKEVEILQTTENMNIIQTYNESRFRALEGVRKTKWKKGKHEGSF